MSEDDNANDVLEKYDVWILPAMNPDGYIFTHETVSLMYISQNDCNLPKIDIYILIIYVYFTNQSRQDDGQTNDLSCIVYSLMN